MLVLLLSPATIKYLRKVGENVILLSTPKLVHTKARGILYACIGVYNKKYVHCLASYPLTAFAVNCLPCCIQSG
jgi:hypothetical protein